MWIVVEIDDVEELECRNHVNVIHMPSPGLRPIRVGGLASQHAIINKMSSHAFTKKFKFFYPSNMDFQKFGPF